jgi:Transglycosylase-like domain/Putative peptidoglycan binding domain
VPYADPAVSPPLSSDPVVELSVRRSLRRSAARRAAAARSRVRRRQGRAGVAVLLGTMTLVAGGAAAQGVTTSKRPSSAKAHSSSAQVQAVQAAIGVEADGIVGPQTRRALKAFQKAQGLPVTGRIDAATVAAAGAGAAAKPLTDGMSSGSGGKAPAALERIAQCESGGDPTAVSSSGEYRGKYQFSRSTWRSMGGDGDPAEATEAEQDRIAGKLYAAQGTTPWPNCA